MYEHIKAVLYAYPLLKTVEKDYKEHILNKAVLSYRTQKPTEELMEYLAGEILEKNELLFVKECVEKMLDRLNATERMLVEIKYFKRSKKIKPASVSKNVERRRTGLAAWGKSTYFRKQVALIRRASGILASQGLTQDFFQTKLLHIELFKMLYDFVKAGKDAKLSQCEREWLGE